MIKIYFILAFLPLFISLNAQSGEDLCNEAITSKIVERLESFNIAGDPIKMMSLIDSFNRVKGDIDLDECPFYFGIEYHKGEAYYLLDRIEESLNQYYSVIKKAEKTGQLTMVSEAYLSIALIHEVFMREVDCFRNLEKAKQYIDLSEDKSAMPRYYVRLASYTRIFFNNEEEAIILAKKAVESAGLYKNVHQEIDGNLIMGFCSKNIEEAIVFLQRAIDLYLKEGQYYGAAAQANNISEKYLKVGNHDLAKRYKDLTLNYLQKCTNLNSGYYELMVDFLGYKKEVFERSNELDSALIYADKMLDIKDKSFYDLNQQSINEIEIKAAVDQEKQNYKESKAREIIFLKIIIVCFILISIIGALLISLLKNKKKVAQQRNEISLKNQDLLKSNLNYEALLSEVHHRVKNNLQNVVSLLVLQKEFSPNELNKQVFDSLSNKILSMSLIHEQLYQEGVYDQIDLDKYFNNLMRHFSLSNQPYLSINYLINANGICLNNETIMPLALTVTELINNSVKYGANHRKELKISLIVEQMEDNLYTLIYQDDGPGYPDGILKKINKTMGTLIIQSMVRQLLGSFETYNDKGAVFRMSFVEKK